MENFVANTYKQKNKSHTNFIKKENNKICNILIYISVNAYYIYTRDFQEMLF